MSTETPLSIDAEIGIIGGLFIDSDSFPAVKDTITAEMFSQPIHRDIFKAITSLEFAGKGIRPVTLIEQMKHDGTFLSDLNKTIVDISGRVYSAAGISDYCRIVRDKYVLRKLLGISDEIKHEAIGDGADASEVLENAESKIFKISSQTFTSNGYKHISEIISESMSSVEHILETRQRRAGIPTQFAGFNQMTGGLHKGELLIVAGRPGTGKTAISLNIAQHLSVDQGRPVGFFSLEMSKDQLIMRLLACEAHVNAKRLRDGQIANRHVPSINAAISLLSDTSMYIEDTGYLSLKDLRAMARQMKSRHKIELLVVDYLQLVSVPHSKTVNNREQEIAKISKSLKALAKELDLPVVALSQLSRQTEMRDSRRPRLSDLRESGALEQDCDTAILLFRPGVYSEDDDKKGFAELIIGKQRNGPTGSVHLTYVDRQTRFDELPISHAMMAAEHPKICPLKNPEYVPDERSLFNGK